MLSKNKSKKTTYLGNSKIKRAGVQLEYSKDQVEEWTKCSQDPEYFILNYAKIINVDHGLVPFEMYDYQKKMVELFHENRHAIIRCSRQIGKCVCINTVIRLRYKKKYIIEIEIGKLYEAFRKFRETEDTTNTVESFVKENASKEK